MDTIQSESRPEGHCERHTTYLTVQNQTNGHCEQTFWSRARHSSKRSSGPTSREEIIRKRLLVDGDGTGDERRINHLLKKFMKWSSREDDGPELPAIRDQLLSQVAQCEYAFLKSRLTAAMTDSELENYDNLSSQIDSEIGNIKKAILSTKEDLKEAKIIRKNRLECEVLIKFIKEQPDRKQTNEKLSNLQGEISSLEERYEALERKLEMRRKQFYVMFTSLHHLQSLLDSDSVDPTTHPMDVSEDPDVQIISTT